MTRLLLYILFYALAFSLGFALRGRFDQWMFEKPHMKSRFYIRAQEMVLSGAPDPDSEEDIDFYPPSTLDALAFNAPGAMREVERRQAELDELFAEQAAEAAEDLAAAGDEDALEPEPGAVLANAGVGVDYDEAGGADADYADGGDGGAEDDDEIDPDDEAAVEERLRQMEENEQAAQGGPPARRGSGVPAGV